MTCTCARNRFVMKYVGLTRKMCNVCIHNGVKLDLKLQLISFFLQFDIVQVKATTNSKFRSYQLFVYFRVVGRYRNICGNFFSSIEWDEKKRKIFTKNGRDITQPSSAMPVVTFVFFSVVNF